MKKKIEKKQPKKSSDSGYSTPGFADYPYNTDYLGDSSSNYDYGSSDYSGGGGSFGGGGASGDY